MISKVKAKTIIGMQKQKNTDQRSRKNVDVPAFFPVVWLSITNISNLLHLSGTKARALHAIRRAVVNKLKATFKYCNSCSKYVSTKYEVRLCLTDFKQLVSKSVEMKKNYHADINMCNDDGLFIQKIYFRSRYKAKYLLLRGENKYVLL